MAIWSRNVYGHHFVVIWQSDLLNHIQRFYLHDLLNFRNQYYGGEFSSHSLNSLIEWAASGNTEKKNESGGEKDQQSDIYETLSCNNDFHKYYFDVEHEFDEK